MPPPSNRSNAPAATFGRKERASLPATSQDQTHEPEHLISATPRKKRHINNHSHVKAEEDELEVNSSVRRSKRRKVTSSALRNNQSSSVSALSTETRHKEERTNSVDNDNRDSPECSPRTPQRTPISQRAYKQYQGMPNDEMFLRVRGYFADVEKPMSIAELFEEIRFVEEQYSLKERAELSVEEKVKADRALYNNLIKKESNALRRTIEDRVGKDEANRFLIQRDQPGKFDPWGQLLQYGHWQPLVSEDAVGVVNTAARRRRARKTKNLYGFWTPASSDTPLEAESYPEESPLARKSKNPIKDYLGDSPPPTPAPKSKLKAATAPKTARAPDRALKAQRTLKCLYGGVIPDRMSYVWHGQETSQSPRLATWRTSKNVVLNWQPAFGSPISRMPQTMTDGPTFPDNTGNNHAATVAPSIYWNRAYG